MNNEENLNRKLNDFLVEWKKALYKEDDARFFYSMFIQVAICLMAPVTQKTRSVALGHLAWAVGELHEWIKENGEFYSEQDIMNFIQSLKKKETVKNKE